MRDESRGCGSDVAGESVENTKCVSEDEFDSLILGNGMLQGTSNFFISVRTLASSCRKAYHAVISCSFVILRNEKLFLWCKVQGP